MGASGGRSAVSAAQEVDFISCACYVSQNDGSTSLSIECINNSCSICKREKK